MKFRKYLSLAMVSCLFLIGCNQPDKSAKTFKKIDKKQLAFEAADEQTFLEQWMREEKALTAQESPVKKQKKSAIVQEESIADLDQRLYDEIVELSKEANELVTLFTIEDSAKGQETASLSLSGQSSKQKKQGSYVASAEESLSVEASTQVSDVEFLSGMAMLQQQYNKFGSDANLIMVKDDRLSGGNCTMWFIKYTP